MNITGEIIIRGAEQQDVANIAVLKQQVWIATYADRGIRVEFSDYVLSEFTQEKVSRAISDKNKVILIAEIDNHCVGCAEIAFNTKCPVESIDAPEITTLYVLERFLGQGIGKILLTKAIIIVKRMNFEDVWLTVFHQNDRAISFYKKNGFTEIGKTHFVMDGNYYENIVMIKRIT
ncbi:MAG: GNAT family N-acetyltransferase [Bacteroidetes bacterium]|nr:GNAT family N-acetyltransferase [Bacteroidota bacterium]